MVHFYDVGRKWASPLWKTSSRHWFKWEYVISIYTHLSLYWVHPVQLLTQIANQPITRQQVNAFWHLDVVKTTCWSSNRASKWVRNGNWSGFERRMVVGARRAGLRISKTADQLQFSRTIISRVFREWSEKENISSERQLCGWKCLVDVRGQRRMGRLVRDDRKEIVTQITTRYNQGMQNTISEHTTRRTLK